MSKRIELSGQKFGAWLVLNYAGQNESGQSTWLCRCECGTNKRVVAQTLRSGLTNSCGCQKSNRISLSKTKHGGAKKKSYQVWCDMIRRCHNKSCGHYKYYGARGITVCRRWMDYLNFVSDMGEPPENHSIERVNNDGNYEPGNCTWATVKDQNKNKRGGRDARGRFTKA